MDSLDLFYLYVIIGLTLVYAQKSYSRFRRKNLEIIDFDKLVLSNEKFVLYLRSFSDDDTAREQLPSPVGINRRNPTFEEKVSRDLRKYNFIAVGRPNEKLPPLGAKRLYIHDDLWRKQVSILIEKATIIVVKPNFTKGIVWELETIMRKEFLTKLVLYHVFTDIPDKKVQIFYYNKFKDLIKNSFNVEMSEFSKNTFYSYFQNDLSHLQVKRLKEIPYFKMLIK